jgi:hypothetical protein
MNKVLLISEETLKTYSLVNDNIDGKYLLPAIQTAQDIDLETLIGKALLDKLCKLVETGEIVNNSKYKTLLDDYITPYLVWQVMSNLQLGINYKLSNSGVITNDDERKSRLDYRNNQLLQEQYKHYADSYAIKLKDYLCSGDYPEYHQCVNHSHAEDVELCGIYLGDININRGYKYK